MAKAFPKDNPFLTSPYYAPAPYDDRAAPPLVGSPQAQGQPSGAVRPYS